MERLVKSKHHWVSDWHHWVSDFMLKRLKGPTADADVSQLKLYESL
jgi:hypothetical protein